ncbi:hypothetical protein [Lysobacter olei]
MSTITVSVSERVYIDADVDVDIETIIKSADEADLHKLRDRLGVGRAPTGQREDYIIERAYLAAKSLADIPRELADLFWHVHGRAI